MPEQTSHPKPVRARAARWRRRMRTSLATIGAIGSIGLLYGMLSFDAQASTHAVGSAESGLTFAWLKGDTPQYWYFDPSGTVPLAQDAAKPLPATLQTPLGSVWKLFVYSYLVGRHLSTPDYVCHGGDPDEVYCCMTGQQVDREHALVQSCGRYFEPSRLHLSAADWRRYWTAAQAPAWLRDMHAMSPSQQVSVAALLHGLQAVPTQARQTTASTLISVLTIGRGQGTLPLYGSVLRTKTWTMPDPTRDGGSIGGAAGWLADGTPVWLGGRGGSPHVLAEAAPQLGPLLSHTSIPDDKACVIVDFFARYPIRQVVGEHGDMPITPGPLEGDYRVAFTNGNWLQIGSHHDLLLEQSDHVATGNHATAPLHIVGRLGLNDYVARVVEREGDTTNAEAAKALAVAARTYLIQHSTHDSGCWRIADSSDTQRVLAHAPSAPARAAADQTDELILVGLPVQYHHDKAAPNQMSWLAAKASAAQGLTFDSILARTWPQASLTALDSSLAGDCEPVANARHWLGANASLWARRMSRADGYETPPLPAVCAVRDGRPYADAQRNRVYIYRLHSEEDRIALAHEYLHLAFQHHPRGLDEAFIERTARILIRTDDSIQ